MDVGTCQHVGTQIPSLYINGMVGHLHNAVMLEGCLKLGGWSSWEGGGMVKGGLGRNVDIVGRI